MAVALAGYADEGKKARLVQMLFGKSTAEVASYLKNLADNGQLNGKVTKEQVEAIKAFNRQLLELQKNTLDVARDLAGPMVSSINDLIERFRAGAREGKGFFETLREEQLKLLGFDGTQVKELREEIEAIDKALARPGISDERRADLEKKRIGRLTTIAKLEGQTSYRASQNYGDAFRPTVPDLPGATPAGSKAKPFVDTGFDEATVAALKAIEATDVNKVRDLQETLSRLFTLQRETRGDPAVVQAIANVRKQLDELAPGAKEAAQAQERLNKLLADTPTGQLNEVLVDIKLLNQAYADGKISVELWAEAVRASTGKLAKGTEEPLAEVSEFARQAARNIQDQLGETLYSSLTGSFDDIGKSWLQLLLRMASQAAAADLGKYLFGADFQKTGKVGGALGGLFNGGLGGFQAAFSGSSLGSSGFGTGLAYGNQDFGGFFANGGFLGAGKWGIAGEKGPEPIIGPAQVVPNKGRRGVTNNFVVNVAGDASENTISLIQGAMAQMRAEQGGN